MAKKSIKLRIGVAKTKGSFEANPSKGGPPKNEGEHSRTFSTTKLGEALSMGKKAWKGPPLPSGHDPKPRWTWNKGMTYSMLSDFTMCRMSFWRKYVCGYQEGSDEEGDLNPLEFGNLFHHLSEKFFGLLPSKDEVEQEAFIYVEGQKRNSTDAGRTKIIDRLALTGAMIFRRHQEYWNVTPTYLPKHYPPTATRAEKLAHPTGVYDREFKVVERERTFKIKHYYAPGRWVWLRGKIDGIFDIPVLGTRSVLENKTKSTIDEIGIKETLHEDLQTNIYLYAASRAGYPMRNVLYNVIRRPKHRWDERKENLRQFVDRIEEETLKKPDHFFKRFDRTVDPTLVEKFIAHTVNPLLYQQHRWWESIAANPMRPWHVHGPDGKLVQREDGSVVVNLEHFERPYGVYDPYAFKATGHQYDMRILNDYSRYRQVTEAELFPELDKDDDAIIVDD